MPLNYEDYLIAGSTESYPGLGFVLQLYHKDCRTWWTVFAGEGVAPRLAHMIRAAEQHEEDCHG